MFHRGRLKDVPNGTSNRDSSQYIFCGFQSEPNLYVPKRIPHVRTFFAFVSAGIDK